MKDEKWEKINRIYSGDFLTFSKDFISVSTSLTKKVRRLFKNGIDVFINIEKDKIKIKFSPGTTFPFTINRSLRGTIYCSRSIFCAIGNKSAKKWFLKNKEAFMRIAFVPQEQEDNRSIVINLPIYSEEKINLEYEKKS